MIGYVAGFIAMISFLPQIIKTLRTRRTDDISIGMLLLTLTTNILYVIYGLLLDLYPIIIMISIMTLNAYVQVKCSVLFQSYKGF